MARKRLFKLLILGLLWLGLAACQSSQTSLPDVEVVEPTQTNNSTDADSKEPIDSATLEQIEAATASGIEDDALIQQSALEQVDPWELVERAKTQDDPILRNELLLAASKGFLSQNHISTAESILSQINLEQLNPEQAIEYQLTKAHFKFLSGDSIAAQQLLNALGAEDIPAHLNDEALELKATIFTSQGQPEQAIETRLQLSDLLGGETANDNLMKLYALMLQLSKPQLYQLSRTINHTDLSGWVDLIEQMRDGDMNETAWFSWRQRNPAHPATAELFDAQLNLIQTGNANSIALLLPLTSRLGRATEAFKQGFQDAERDATGQNASRIYDIGDEFAP